MKTDRMHRAIDIAAAALSRLAFVTLAVTLFALVGKIVVEGAPVIDAEFLFGPPSYHTPGGGAGPAIFGAVAVSLMAAISALPAGVGAAIYLSEYAKESTLSRALRFAVNNLAGAPSVVIGLFGFGFFVLFVGQNIDEAAGYGTVFGRPAMLWAAATLATLMTPMIAATTYAALQAARLEDKEAARALGASQWQTVKKVVLPRAFPSIVSGALFTIGRAFGETAPVMFLGAAFFLPQLPVAEVSVFGFDVPTINPMSEFMHLGYHLFTLNTRSVDPSASMAQQYGAAFAMIAVTMFFNVVAFAFRDRFRKFIDRV